MAEEANVQQPALSASRMGSTPNAQRSMEEEENAERSTPNAQRPMKDEANVQRPTPNAQRSMKKGAISLQVLFCRSNADEENSDQFFSLAKDGRHSRPREHCGLLQEPQPASTFFQLLKANPELVNKIFA
jgi:hypothetical protein